MEMQYNLIVIGAGPGGYPAAIRAAQEGWKVAVVEKGGLGGTCLNNGCIPAKTLLHASGLYRKIREAAEEGIRVSDLQIDMDALQNRRKDVIASLREGIALQFQKNKIALYRGNAVITEHNQVTVTAPEQTICLSAPHILAAAGSEPAILPIPGLSESGVENSTSLLSGNRLYDHLVIIGGGVVGMEFAQYYSDFGKKVTVLEAMDRILPGMDREIAQNLKMILKKRGVEIHTKAAVTRVEKREQGGWLCYYKEGAPSGKEGQEAIVSADGLLLAVGRRACGEGIFSPELAGRAGVERGRIPVDENYQTRIPGIYAVGDVTGGIQLAHAATAQGLLALDHMKGRLPSRKIQLIPSCVYTDPEIASVGMTADEAKAAGIPVKTGKYIMSLNGRSLLSRQERGFIKLVAEESTGRLLGAQLMCARATDMIGELTLAIAGDMTAKEIAAAVMPHPTFAEGIGEAAEELCGLSEHCPGMTEMVTKLDSGI
nr:dihydrolipoyl dehydrogenase [uncultured Eisenbergiella sp.]